MYEYQSEIIYSYKNIDDNLNYNLKVTNTYSTTVIAKIKGMPRSLFYDIPCYVTMDYERWLLTREEICAFEAQNHANYMHISHFRCGVDLVYFEIKVN